MNEPKPKSLDEKDTLISELREMNRQIQDYRSQIDAYERNRVSDEGFSASFIIMERLQRVGVNLLAFQELRTLTVFQELK